MNKLFAGEPMNPDFWSFMHGARLSGLREAQRVQELLIKAGEDENDECDYVKPWNDETSN